MNHSRGQKSVQRGVQRGGQRGVQRGGHELVSNGRYNKSCSIPEIFYGIIIGTKGVTKNNIEAETRTRIYIPSKYNQSDNKGDIIVNGSTEADVVSAIERLYAIVDNARLKFRPSHFVSIPMNFDDLKTRFNELKQKILNDSECSQSRGVCEELFQNENRLHLSIVILLLGDQREIDQAKKTLQECKEFIDKQLNGKELVIRIKGLDIMNDGPLNHDPTKARVVYGKVKENDNEEEKNDLRMIVDEIFTRFVNCKLANRKVGDIRLEKKVKLHLTLMNLTFKEKKDEKDEEKKDRMPWERTKRQEERETFDASTILQNFGSYDFGQFKINQIDLSIMGHLHYDANGHYGRESMIDF